MLCISYGTRPEWNKIKPVLAALTKEEIPYRTILVAQHTDLLARETIAADVTIRIVDAGHVPRLNNIVSNIMDEASQVFVDLDCDALIVQGDTTSAMGMALAAYHQDIPVIHLEAGLRTYDIGNPYPEEANRKIISTLSDVHLCPTANNLRNLTKELHCGHKVVVGNPGLDNLKDIETEDSNDILVTMHRRENHKHIGEYFKAFNQLGRDYPQYNFMIPIHPNPNVMDYKKVLDPSAVTVMNALPHRDFIDSLRRCHMVITDSGGVQEEASFLNKPHIVCRSVTERPESIGWHGYICDSPDNLQKVFKIAIEAQHGKIDPCPFGDGNSGELIAKVLKELMND